MISTMRHFFPLCIVLLFISASAHDHDHHHEHAHAAAAAAGDASQQPQAPSPGFVDPAFLNEKKPLGPHEKFGDPFGNPQDYKEKKLPDDFGTKQFQGTDIKDFVGGPVAAPIVDEDSFKGKWELFTDNSGVSAMHSILLPNCDHVLMYDATIWRISKILLPNGQCRVLDEKTGDKDCYAHSVLLNIKTAELIPLMVNTDTWCSSGGLTLEGNFVSTGGFQGGANTVRYLNNCPKCAWKEDPSALAAPRWYSTQQQLADGRMIVIGGRAAQSYEYIPQEGTSNAKPFFFDFLKQTTDPDENNLYPFVFLSPDKNVFVFANNRSVLLNPYTNAVVKEFPVLPGGHRNYPASGMAVLLPLEVGSPFANDIVDAEVLVCGGSAHVNSYTLASNGNYYEALQDCGRLKITRPRPNWRRELMPSPRIMGDMVILPTGEVLMLNGAKRGASGWGFAREPNKTPVLFNYRAPDKKQLFKELNPSTIARMYHSTSVVLPDGKVLVAGSNTNNGYIEDAMFPTELRVEKFSPPYLDPAKADKKPKIEIDGYPKTMTYAQEMTIKISLNEPSVLKKNFKVTMYVPAFTTHGVAMNQRLVILLIKDVVKVGEGKYDVQTMAPPTTAVAPTGYYLLSVVHIRLPTEAVWVQLHEKK
ncbi:Aldehyde oxidase GLOX1 [Linum grandiflorum]|uniref:Glyoxal oxidase 1 n=1 Tax=Linum grandiflorum TaxID=559336 RepID=G9M8Q4_9ROSI|nr:glyoxal oxidase 1 [Linum grandiflorum]